MLCVAQDARRRHPSPAKSMDNAVEYPSQSVIEASSTLLHFEPNPSEKPMMWAQWMARCKAGGRSYTNTQLAEAEGLLEKRMGRLGLSAGRGKRRRRVTPEELADLKLAQKLAHSMFSQLK